VAATQRMLALAMVLKGWTRTEAARSDGRDRQTLSDWVHCYNELDLAGLVNPEHAGVPARKLTAEQEANVAEWVRQGSDLEKH
jgi:transposase